MEQTIVQQIKEKLDIVDVIGQVVPLQRSGTVYQGICPFHNERSPSFKVFPNNRNWHCFGCNEGGDLLAFVMKHQNLTFPAALEMLAVQAGIDPATIFPEAERAQQRERARLVDLNGQATQWFRQQLMQAPEALAPRAYLATERGLTNETLERAEIGYAPHGNRLTTHLLQQGATLQELIDAGLSRRSGEDFFQERIMIPIVDAAGRCSGFGGRAWGDVEPKYLNSPTTLIFDKSGTLYGLHSAHAAIRLKKEMILVEGYFDVLIAQQEGYAHTVGCCGTAFTPRHAQLVKQIVQTVYLAFDPDSAGASASAQAIEKVQEQFAIRVVALPGGADPDELILHRPDLWTIALNQAQPFMEFLFDRAIRGRDLANNPDERIAVARQLAPMIARLPDNISRAVYAERLAARVRIPLPKVMHFIEATAAKRPLPPLPPAPPRSAPLSHGEYVIGALCCVPSLIVLAREWLEAGDFLDADLRGLWEAFSNAQVNWHQTPLSMWATTLDPLLTARTLVLMAQAQSVLPSAPLERDRVLQDRIRKFKIAAIRRRILELGYILQDDSREFDALAIHATVYAQIQQLLDQQIRIQNAF